jgi:hypothetical protein
MEFPSEVTSFTENRPTWYVELWNILASWMQRHHSSPLPRPLRDEGGGSKPGEAIGICLTIVNTIW